MTPGDVARVLAKASAFDQRTIGKSDVAAWYEILKTINVDDALEAVTRHYTAETRRVMPADIVRLAKEVRAERARAERRRAGPLALPSRYEPDFDREFRIARGLAICADVVAPLKAHLAANRLKATRVPLAIDAGLEAGQEAR